MIEFKDKWISNILPRAARQQLEDAVRVDVRSPYGESFARELALKKATDRVKVQYPEFFRRYKFHN